MALSPSFHPLNVFRSAKVRTIFRLVEPLGLGSGLAGLATLGFCAVALSVSTIWAGIKELSAMEHLQEEGEFMARPQDSPPPSPRYPSLIKNKNPSRRKTFVSKMDEENTGNPEEDLYRPS